MTHFFHYISWLKKHICPGSHLHTSSLTPCVKVSSTSTISACTLVSSPSKRPDAGMEHTIMWSVTNTLATRVSLNWKAPPRSSSVSMVRSNRSVLMHILRIMQRWGVGPMCPCIRHGCSKTLHSFCRTRTHVSRPSPENSWIPARLHLRSLCKPVEKEERMCPILFNNLFCNHVHGDRAKFYSWKGDHVTFWPLVALWSILRSVSISCLHSRMHIFNVPAKVG